MEKTVEMKLVRSELEDIRARLTVCSQCGGVFVREDDYHKVCDLCVHEALQLEGFTDTVGGHVEV